HRVVLATIRARCDQGQLTCVVQRDAYGGAAGGRPAGSAWHRNLREAVRAFTRLSRLGTRESHGRLAEGAGKGAHLALTIEWKDGVRPSNYHVVGQVPKEFGKERRKRYTGSTLTCSLRRVKSSAKSSARSLCVTRSWQRP